MREDNLFYKFLAANKTFAYSFEYPIKNKASRKSCKSRLVDRNNIKIIEIFASTRNKVTFKVRVKGLVSDVYIQFDKQGVDHE